MVGISAALFLSGCLAFLTTTEGSKSTHHAADMDFPEDSEAFIDFLLKYTSCSGDECDFINLTEPQQLSSTKEPTSTEEQKVTVPSDFGYCVDFMKKKEMFEAKHPELMPLKLKLLSYFDKFLFDYTSNPEEKKEHLIKFLNYIIEITQKLIFVIGEKELKPVHTEVPIYPTEEIIAEEIDHPSFEIPEEIIAEMDHPSFETAEEIFMEEIDQPSFVGSVRGIPGIHYPNYTEVPITSFSCSDKKYVPGFYADLETGCQVFHVCYEHRRESFLCPVGTTFNQPILACDYWYSSNCSLSSHYYDVNAKKYEPEEVFDKTEENISQIITTIIAEEKPILPQIHVKSKETALLKTELERILKFFPVKAKIVDFPVKSKVVPIMKPVVRPKLVKAAVPVVKAKITGLPIVKAKVAAAAMPVVKAKVAAAAMPVVKAKVAAAVPIMKYKVASAAVPIVKTKFAAAAAKPVVKAKVAAAAAVPVVKAKVAAIPVVKAKIASAATIPVLKAKAASAAASSAALKAKTAAKVIPAVKVAASKPKFVLAPLKAKAIVKGKSAMISPLTKKALALGYMKLLKAKKLALMG